MCLPIDRTHSDHADALAWAEQSTTTTASAECSGNTPARDDSAASWLLLGVASWSSSRPSSAKPRRMEQSNSAQSLRATSSDVPHRRELIQVLASSIVAHGEQHLPDASTQQNDGHNHQLTRALGRGTSRLSVACRPCLGLASSWLSCSTARPQMHFSSRFGTQTSMQWQPNRRRLAG